MHTVIKNTAAVGVGGALGTLLRYELNKLTLFTGYPYGTLIENIGGSFLLGIFVSYLFLLLPKEWMRLGLGVGFCGGFTTMSTFAADTVLLAGIGVWNAALYMVLSVFGSILMAGAGIATGCYLMDLRNRRKEI